MRNRRFGAAGAAPRTARIEAVIPVVWKTLANRAADPERPEAVEQMLQRLV